MRKFFVIGCLTFLVFFLQQCKKETKTEEQPLQAEENEQYSGGQVTVFDQSPSAFGSQAPGLTGNDELLFFVGHAFFTENWVTAPSSTTARDGLGPFFNSNSCSGCHFKDGRGRAPQFDGEVSSGLVLRLSIPGAGSHGEPLNEPIYGKQLQDQAISSILKEGSYSIVYTETSGTFSDGTTYNLRKPEYQINNLNYGAMDASVQISARVARQMIGLGLLEALSEATILSRADENDVNSDGISGRANYVWDYKNQQNALGRFGWKAEHPSLYQQSAAALYEDIGISTSLYNSQNCTTGDCSSLANGGSPEIDEDDLLKVALYCQTLAVPARRNWTDQTVLKGKQLFINSGCVSCHAPTMTTGTHPTISALSNQTIHPYSDLLLHDMGVGLADSHTDFYATGREWRTPPLWGIGLFQTVNGHTFYLHDGRARSLEEAILWHGGEAVSAKYKFVAMSKTDRDALIRFLNSL
ncbi:MAG: c-type cytochrome [Bacteroidetes bacterium]|nr:c-type cytochrome [Bacteroidota bacterium]